MTRALALLPLLLACDPKSEAPPFDVAQSDLSREMAPDYSDAELSALVDGNTAFAFDIYHQIAVGTDNTFLSPYSMSLALAMTWAGARGDTETQLAEAMRFSLSQERLHPTFDGLDLWLYDRVDSATYVSDTPFELNIADSVWGQTDYPFESDYLDTLALNYGASVYLLDFAADPEGARETINSWVEDQTKDRIKDLLSKGSVTADTRFVLTNAIYFKAAWGVPFEDDLTEDGDFTRLDGSTVSAPYMHRRDSLPLAEGDGFIALELPYDGDAYSMVAILPDEGRFSEIEASLDGPGFQAILETLAPSPVSLSLPKFHVESEFSLGTALQALGATDAFSAAADFTGISETGELYISSVIHKSFISIDEEGTEAAAATAVVMDGTTDEEEPEYQDVAFNRSFLYAIIERDTGTVLFLGRTTDPSDGG